MKTLRCLFCKQISDGSRSTEHIIPESLGNLSQTLPPGIVCDSCNNYFSRKVEKPFLEHESIKRLRFRQGVPSKKGKVPAVDGVLNAKHPVVLHKHLKGPFIGSVDVPTEAYNEIIKKTKGTIIFPTEGTLPNGQVVSRFVANVALEVLGQRLLTKPDMLECLIDDQQLDPIRNHARWGEISNWPVSVRRIYDANQRWLDSGGDSVQVVHEFDILMTELNEMYFVMAIFGIEFVINIGGPDLDGYQMWLDDHNNLSPLYWGKNAGTDELSPID